MAELRRAIVGECPPGEPDHMERGRTETDR
ncbi:hypothetical protein HDA31_005337 [Micromonospora carbonacea subsp. aurantiaca]|nr:hypothetical protein [Micromonospora carbonacea]